jgi:hypothetical protein
MRHIISAEPQSIFADSDCFPFDLASGRYSSQEIG